MNFGLGLWAVALDSEGDSEEVEMTRTCPREEGVPTQEGKLGRVGVGPDLALGQVAAGGCKCAHRPRGIHIPLQKGQQRAQPPAHFIVGDRAWGYLAWAVQPDLFNASPGNGRSLG